jgi:uncharacterized protein YcfL
MKKKLLLINFVVLFFIGCSTHQTVKNQTIKDKKLLMYEELKADKAQKELDKY